MIIHGITSRIKIIIGLKDVIFKRFSRYWLWDIHQSYLHIPFTTLTKAACLGTDSRSLCTHYQRSFKGKKGEGVEAHRKEQCKVFSRSSSLFCKAKEAFLSMTGFHTN